MKKIIYTLLSLLAISRKLLILGIFFSYTIIFMGDLANYLKTGRPIFSGDNIIIYIIMPLISISIFLFTISLVYFFGSKKEVRDRLFAAFEDRDFHGIKIIIDEMYDNWNLENL